MPGLERVAQALPVRCREPEKVETGRAGPSERVSKKYPLNFKSPSREVGWNRGKAFPSLGERVFLFL